MKTKEMLAVGRMLVGGALLGALLGVLPGCEGNSSPDTGGIDSYFADHPLVSDPRDPSAPQDVFLTPASASVSFLMQLITFTVAGGEEPYHWGVANGNGTVASRAEDTKQGVYTATTLAGNSVIVYDARGHSAIATVGTGGGSALVITPSVATIATNLQSLAFSVSGGSPPYNWAPVIHPADGFLNTYSGASVFYTRTSTNGVDNGLTASDSAGGSVTVTIHQP